MDSKRSFNEYLDTVRGQPVYVILGVQGSGTNLLRRILTSAFNFSVVQDQAVVFNAGLKLGAHPSRATVQREFATIRDRMLPSTWSRKTQRRIKSNGSFEGIQQHFDPTRISNGAEFAQFVYAYSAFSRGTTLMAIKSDDLWETIGGIDQVLPNRRIILLTRDFRDNLLSITRKPFGPVDPLVAARYVKERFAHYDAEYRNARHEHRLHVRFEELLDEPDNFVARFCQHFGLPDPAPIDTGRIRRNNMKKWSVLSSAQLAHCEGMLWRELHDYGYGTESSARLLPDAHTWRRAVARDAVQRVPQKLRALVRRLGK